MAVYDFLRRLWAKLETPITELTTHFLLSLCAIAFIFLTEQALHAAHLDVRSIPLIGLSLSDWLFDLDVVASSLILIAGLIKAFMEML